jgi:hypothetical protein
MILLGLWREEKDSKSKLPWPEVSRRLLFPEPQKEIRKVLAFLKGGHVTVHYKGWSECRICGQPNGSRYMERGPFRYPEGYIHYIEEHAVEPDPRLIAYLKRKGKI